MAQRTLGFAGRTLLESRERGPRIANLVLPGNNQAKPIAEETAIVSSILSGPSVPPCFLAGVRELSHSPFVLSGYFVACQQMQSVRVLVCMSPPRYQSFLNFHLAAVAREFPLSAPVLEHSSTSLKSRLRLFCCASTKIAARSIAKQGFLDYGREHAERNSRRVQLLTDAVIALRLPLRTSKLMHRALRYGRNIIAGEPSNLAMRARQVQVANSCLLIDQIFGHSSVSWSQFG